MKKFIELNSEIEKLYNPEIQILNNYKNISFYGEWVNDLFNKVDFFNNWEAKIKEQIDKVSDPDSPTNIKFIKVFHQDVLHKLNTLNENDCENLDYLKSFPQFAITFDNASNPSKTKSSEFYFDSENFVEYGEFLDRMARIFNIKGFDSFDGEHDPESQKDILQDEILFKLKANENELDKFYSLGFLSYCLDNTKTILKNITKHLDSFVNLIKKLENFEEDKLTLEEVYDNDPNHVKFEFKVSKKEIAILFKNLKDFGVFHIEKNGFNSEQTQLIKYINNANMYFYHNGNIKPVKGITKEFAKVYGAEERVMHQDIEKKFLKDLIKKLTERIKEIDSEDF